jgi:uncharacterized protein
MSLKNCTKCGRVFLTAHSSLCPDCVKAGEDAFKKVRDFVKENPKVAIDVVVEATGVPEDEIRTYLRQGKLDVASFSGQPLSCRRCGKPVESGEFCVLCRKDISNNFRGDVKKDTTNETDQHVTFTKQYRNRG